MTLERLRRRTARLGTLTAASVLLLGVVPQLASADSGTRTINSYVTCADGTLMYGFEIDYGSGWTTSALGASGYQVNSYEKEVTFIVPSTATSVSLDTYCGGNGFVEDSTWIGYTYSLTPGTSTATANWTCALYDVAYYGDYTIDRSCSLDSISYS
ncbi:MAG TPA: hypothetical protein VGM10_32490 [Actinocrinis sp.]|jgi:hypothetical protein